MVWYTSIWKIQLIFLNYGEEGGGGRGDPKIRSLYLRELGVDPLMLSWKDDGHLKLDSNLYFFLKIAGEGGGERWRPTTPEKKSPFFFGI